MYKNRYRACGNNNNNYNDNMYENSDLTMLNMNCNCGFEEDSVFPSNPMLAQSYVPIQTMNKTFTPEVGLKMGTIFPELVSPYDPGQSKIEIDYIRRTNKIGEGCNA